MALEGTWIDDIIKYVVHEILPKDQVKSRKIQKPAARYLIYDGTLYRRSFTKPLL